MFGGSKLTEYQTNRLRELLGLEDEADDIHKRLIVAWNKGERSSELREQDEEVRARRDEARRNFKIVLRNKS